MNRLQLEKKLNSVVKPTIEPDYSSIEKYLYYRNLKDKYWLEKDRWFIAINGDKFWEYKFGTILNKQDWSKYENNG